MISGTTGIIASPSKNPTMSIGARETQTWPGMNKKGWGPQKVVKMPRPISPSWSVFLCPSLFEMEEVI